MIVNPTDVAALYAAKQEPRQFSPSSAGEEPEQSASQPSAQQDSGPAVITAISSAALATARAVKEPDQTADQNRPAPADQAAALATPPAGPQSSPQSPSRIDLLV